MLKLSKKRYRLNKPDTFSALLRMTGADAVGSDGPEIVAHPQGKRQTLNREHKPIGINLGAMSGLRRIVGPHACDYWNLTRNVE